MRLLEIAPNFVQNQNSTLMTVLNHLEKKFGKGTKIPIKVVSNFMHNIGYSFDYDTFKQMYDSNQELKDIVSNFNQDSITVGSDDDDLTGDREVNADEKVDQMSQKAAKDQLQL